MGKRPTSVRHLRAGSQVGAREPAKYRNKKVSYDGYVFDSGVELRRYKDLKLLEGAGKITNLKVHPKWTLKCGGTPVKIKSKGYPNGRTASYSADFAYFDADTGAAIVEDVKGYDTYTSRLKRAMIEAEYSFKVIIVR